MKTLKKLSKGDRIPASDYSTIVEAVNRFRSPVYETEFRVPLYGESTLAVPVYSLLEIYDAGSTTEDETPVVKVRKPTSANKALATNGNFPIAANETGPIVLIGLTPFKVDTDPADVGFAVGDECGKDDGTYQAASDGTGLICLSSPITYESTKKFIWACLRPVGSGDFVEDVRWVAPVIEFYKSGSWHNIDTAENC